jgi:hypothetical protein
VTPPWTGGKKPLIKESLLFMFTFHSLKGTPYLNCFSDLIYKQMWSLIQSYWACSKPLIYRPGPGRNIPDLSVILQQAKVRLKSPEAIQVLQSMNNIPETMLVRASLRHVTIPTRQTEWPCSNPLFIELRKRVQPR